VYPVCIVDFQQEEVTVEETTTDIIEEEKEDESVTIVNQFIDPKYLRESYTFEQATKYLV